MLFWFQGIETLKLLGLKFADFRVFMFSIELQRLLDFLVWGYGLLLLSLFIPSTYSFSL